MAYVSSGTVTGQTVTDGGTMYVFSSGMADLTTISSGGVEVVYSGGTTSFTDIASSGFVAVEAGGTALSGSVRSGGDEYVGTGGTASGGTIDNGGEIDVISGTAIGIMVNSGGRMFAVSGGQVFDANVLGGAVYVSRAEAFNTDLTGSGGLLYITDSGAASGAIVTSGAEAYVFGGRITDINVSAGGSLHVALQGIVTSALVEDATAEVDYNGQLNSSTIGSGGLLFVSGTASGITVLSGGYEVLGFGSEQQSTVLSGGSVFVVDGRAYGVIVNSGAQLFVSEIADTVAVRARGFVETSSELEGTFESGAVGLVTGFDAFFGTLESGATLIIGAQNQDITVEAGAHIISSGVAIIDRPGDTVNTYKNVDHKTFSSGADIICVLPGGVASGAVVKGDVSVDLFSGGSANGINEINAALTIFAGATISNVAGIGGEITDMDGVLQSATISGDAGSHGFLLVEAFGDTTGAQIDAGGDEVVSDNGIASQTTVASGGEQDIISAGASVANSTVQSGGIQFVISGGSDLSPVIDGGTVNIVGAGTLFGATFEDSGGLILCVSSDLPKDAVTGFGKSDAIEFTDLTYSAADSVTVVNAGTVTITTVGKVFNLEIAGATSGTPYLLTTGTDGTDLALIDLADAPCFAAGTRILTPRGEIAVEALAVGDIVITSTGEDAAITWIGRRRIDLTRHPKPANAQPIRLAAHALADGVPSRDLILSPDHALFLNHVLIPAKALIDHRNVQQLNRRAVTYYHIELAAHAIIFAENCAVETYLETGNRGAFENAAGALTLHPDFAQSLREQQSCAPFITTGPALDAATEQLARQYYTTRAADNQRCAAGTAPDRSRSSATTRFGSQHSQLIAG